jgi:hypothetical protein
VVKDIAQLKEIVDQLESWGKYTSLVRKIEKSDFSDKSFIFEALFAYLLESNGIPLKYEARVNPDNDRDVDFLHQRESNSKFCFELLRPEMKEKLKQEYQETDEEGLFGVELTQDHEKNHLRPEVQTIFLQEKLLEKVDKFPEPKADLYSTIVVDCSNIHFGHIDDEDCRMVMYGKTRSWVWQEHWLDNQKRSRIKGLLEPALEKRGAEEFRRKITGVICVRQLSRELLQNAYVALNYHRGEGHRQRFKEELLDMSPFQGLHWIEGTP